MTLRLFYLEYVYPFLLLTLTLTFSLTLTFYLCDASTLDLKSSLSVLWLWLFRFHAHCHSLRQSFNSWTYVATSILTLTLRRGTSQLSLFVVVTRVSTSLILRKERSQKASQVFLHFLLLPALPFEIPDMNRFLSRHPTSQSHRTQYKRKL